MNPLGPLAGQAIKSLIGSQGPKSPEQKALEADLEKLLAPLVARIEALEKRVAAMNRVAQSSGGPHPERADDI